MDQTSEEITALRSQLAAAEARAAGAEAESAAAREKERQRKRDLRYMQQERDRNPGRNHDGAAQERARQSTGGLCVCGEFEAVHRVILGRDLGYPEPAAGMVLKRIINGKCSGYHEKGL